LTHTFRGGILKVVKVNLYEAKARLSALVERAAAGEEIVIAKAGRPLARLMPLAEDGERRPGRAKGRIRIGVDFDAPLPPDLAAAFGTTGSRRTTSPRRDSPPSA
jgi:prevent-host-death family protein